MRTLLVAALLTLPALAGCLGSPAASSDTPDVLATFYPLAFLAQRIAGDDLQVGTLVAPGVEPHEWEPSLTDLARIGNAKVVLTQGLGFEPWVEDVRKNMPSGRDPFVVTTTGLDLLPGVGHGHGEGDHAHGDDDAHHDEDAHDEHDAHAENETHDEHELHAENETHDDHEAHAGNETHDAHSHDEHEDHDGEALNETSGSTNDSTRASAADEEELAHEDEESRLTYDPHTWLDPLLFEQQARIVEQALAAAYPELADGFAIRRAELSTELLALHHQYEAGLSDCEVRVILANHDAYGYIADRHGFEVHAIHGLSPGAEPDARTIDRLVQVAQENDVRVVYYEELVTPRVAQVIANHLGGKTLVLSPLEGLTPEASNEGHDYLSLMRANLENLREGMRCA